MTTGVDGTLVKWGIALLKQIPKWIVLAATLVSAVFLFLPQCVRGRVYLPEPDLQTGPIATLCLVFFGFGSAWIVAEPLVERSRKARKRKKWLDSLMADLSYLTPQEWSILAAYVRENARSLQWPTQDGTAQQLAARHYLVQAPVSQLGYSNYAIQDWIWRALQEGRVNIPEDTPVRKPVQSRR